MNLIALALLVGSLQLAAQASYVPICLWDCCCVLPCLVTVPSSPASMVIQPDPHRQVELTEAGSDAASANSIFVSVATAQRADKDSDSSDSDDDRSVHNLILEAEEEKSDANMQPVTDYVLAPNSDAELADIAKLPSNDANDHSQSNPIPSLSIDSPQSNPINRDVFDHSESKPIVESSTQSSSSADASSDFDSEAVSKLPMRPSFRRGASQNKIEVPVSKWKDYPLRNFKALLDGKVYDYEVSLPTLESLLPSQRTRAIAFNPFFSHIKKRALKFFVDTHFDLFATLYPGLREVPISVHDISGLLVFGILTSFSNDYSYFPDKFHEAVDVLRVNFDTDSEILNFFVENPIPNLFALRGAFAVLFRLAMETNCFYTVEAFFVTKKQAFEFPVLLASIEASVKSEDARLFGRIADQLIEEDIDWVEVTHYAAKSCAMRVLENLLYEKDVSLVRAVEQRFGLESLFIFLAENKCHSPSILNHQLWTDEDLDAGMLASIEVGNWQLFQTLITDDWHSYPSLNAVMKQALKIIYGPSQQTLGSFLVKQDFGIKFYFDLIKNILKLDCPEKKVLADFSWILKEMPRPLDSFSEESFDPIQHALFMDTREYLGTICVFGNFDMVKALPDGGPVPVWDVIKGARDYESLMEIFIYSPRYSVLYCFGNPNLTRRNWMSIFNRHRVSVDDTFEVSLITLAHGFALDTEIITNADREFLGLQEPKIWTLLHLAVVAFNVRLVDALLDAESPTDWGLSMHDRRTPIDLAKQLLSFLESPSYPYTHQMPRAIARGQIRNEMRRKYPNFYAQPQDPTSATHIRNRAIFNCKAIISRLQAVRDGVYRIKSKSMLSAATEEEEDYDI